MNVLLIVDLVVKYNIVESCWVVFYGVVYDVIEFFFFYLGGFRIIF